MAGPSVATVKRLFAVSGNRCAFPGCEERLADVASESVMGEVCHIKAKSSDGPRYDAQQTDEERHGFGNLVLLCPTHHTRVDRDPDRYTVERLLEIKAQHEARYAGGAEPSDVIAQQFLPQFAELLERLKQLLAEDRTLAARLTAITGDGNVVGDHNVATVNKLSAGDYAIQIGQLNLTLSPDQLRALLPPTYTPRPRQLPADLADFTGREEEVRELVALLGEGAGGATISVIGGMGGVGKTALAVHVAHQVVNRYPDGQVVVEMGGTSEQPLTPLEAMARVIHAFQPELRLPDDPNDVTSLYRTTLEGRQVLLLLDNAANSAQVRPLVVPAECGLVVTSRHNISLPGLRHFDLDALPEKKAHKLLRAIVGRRRATGKELDAIAALCGRLPLALRVAGDFLVVHPDWSAGEYAQALADERERLARLKHEDLDVGAVLGLSAAQLVRERADLAARWQMLSVFPAPFERAAVAAVWGVEEEEARDGLSDLAARSLVLYEREGGVYRLHDLMRLVAEDAFGYGGGERDMEAERVRLGEAALRHAAYYLVVGSRADDLYLQGGEHVLEGLRLFDGAWPHLRAAHERMREREDRAAAQWTSEFPGRVVYVLDLRLPPRDKIPILEAAAAAARQTGERSHEGVHLGNLGEAYRNLGDSRRAIEYYEQALTVAREIGNRHGEGADLGNLGLAYSALGETRRAIEYFEQCLVIHREIGDRRGEGADLGNLGLAYRALGETRRAIAYYEQALKIAREIGDRRGEGADLGNLGLAYSDLGETRRAIEYSEQALKIAREIGDRRGEGNHLGNLGIAYAALGEIRRAIEYYEQALAIAREIGDRRREGNHLGSIGNAYADLGKVRRAIEYYQQCLVIHREIGDRLGEGSTLDNLGSAYFTLGEVRRAIEYYEQALAIFREIGDRRGEGNSLADMGLLVKQQGDLARARQLWEQALRIFEAIEDPNAQRVRGWLDELAGASAP